jgi:hypothetical protein
LAFLNQSLVVYSAILAVELIQLGTGEAQVFQLVESQGEDIEGTVLEE